MNKITNKNFIFLSILLVILICTFSFLIFPSLARIISNNDEDIYWDGKTISTKLEGLGTKESPYLINSGSDFAYFIKIVNENDEYKSSYYELESDIYLNKGFIEYNTKNIKYYLNNNIYILSGSDYYLNDKKIGSLNTINTINNFIGNINGNNHTIYGLFISNTTNSYLFNNLQGTIENITFTNLYLSGSGKVGLINNSISSNISNIIINGTLINSGTYINLSDIEDTNNYYNDLSKYYEEETTKYYNDITSFIINDKNSNINNLIIKGNFIGKNLVSSIIGISNNKSTITNSYSLATINSLYYSGGLVGYSNNSSLNISNSYFNGSLYGKSSGGIISLIDNTNIIKLYNIISLINNTNNETLGTIIGDYINHGEDVFSNVYYEESTYNSIGYNKLNTNTNIIAVTLDDIYNKDFQISLGFLEYEENSTTKVWTYYDNSLPFLYFDDETPPTIRIDYLDLTWQSNTSTEIKTININSTGDILINAKDINSDILKIEYYISNSNSTNLLDYNTIDWQLYNSTISIIDNSFYTIYVKAIDSNNNISYSHSDLLVLDGYNKSYSEGNTYNNIDDYNIFNSNSIINITFEHKLISSTIPYNTNSKKLIESNTIIPKNTIIYLYDYILGNTYKYIVGDDYYYTLNDKYYYNLTNFTSITDSSNYQNNIINYYNNNEFYEKFTLSFDFSNTNISTYNLIINIVLENNKNILCNTLTNNKDITIVENNNKTKYNLELNLSYSNLLDLSTINNKTTITYTINEELSLNNNTLIYDHNYFDKKYYLKLYITDSNNNLLTNNFINNLTYTYNNKDYYTKLNGYIYIPITDISNELTITVNSNNNDIENGLYNLNFTIYNIYNNKITATNSIPLYIISNGKIYDNYSFNTNINSNDRIIVKSNNTNSKLSINTYYSGNYNNPNLKIKVLKKLSLNTTSSYEPINVNDIFTNNFKLYKDNYYDISDITTNNYIIELNPKYSNLSLGSYEIIIALYDNDNLICTSNFNILVK
jgi:hypothetical protein